MKKLMLTVAVALIALTAVGSASAQHHHGGGNFSAGIFIGGPVWGAPYYAPYYSPFYAPYYSPAPIYVDPAPVIIQRSHDAYVERNIDYWYYCAQSATYYPYAQTCPAGWMQVVPGSAPPK
jgi:hypothetical protein